MQFIRLIQFNLFECYLFIYLLYLFIYLFNAVIIGLLVNIFRIATFYHSALAGTNALTFDAVSTAFEAIL